VLHAVRLANLACRLFAVAGASSAITALVMAPGHRLAGVGPKDKNEDDDEDDEDDGNEEDGVRTEASR
jgi:hypothetical protein